LTIVTRQIDVHGKSRPSIALTPFVPVEESVLRAVRPFVENTFEATVEISEPLALPVRAYDPARRQHSSSLLLDVLARMKKPEVERQLGIADVDLYASDLNFVFGQADSRRGVAVFSTARLRTANHKRFVHRAATEAIHELAHTYALPHCANPRCVMWFSNTLEETDHKGTAFCRTHAEVLRRAIHGAGPSRP
jgi:archaemetzincin